MLRGNRRARATCTPATTTTNEAEEQAEWDGKVAAGIRSLGLDYILDEAPEVPPPHYVAITPTDARTMATTTTMNEGEKSDLRPSFPGVNRPLPLAQLHPLIADGGAIHLVWGPMFSGKTTELLRRADRVRVHAADRTLLIKHAADTRHRDAPSAVGTHGGARDHRCLPAYRLAELDAVVRAAGARHVFVDEGQFFPDLAEWCRAWARAGACVTVAALNADAQQRPWPSVAALEPWCDTTTKLTAVCACGRDAALSVVIDAAAAGSEVAAAEVGEPRVAGADVYAARCRSCHEAGRR